MRGLSFLRKVIFMRRFVISVLSAAVFLMVSASGAYAASDKAWDVRCKTNEKDSKEYCEMFQMITVKDTGQRFVELAFFKGQDNKMGGIIILPLGLMVAKQVMMQIDEGDAMAFSFHTCTPGGCLGRINVSDKLMAQMRKGSHLKIATHDQSGKTFNVKLSLSGFSKAYKGLAKKK